MNFFDYLIIFLLTSAIVLAVIYIIKNRKKGCCSSCSSCSGCKDSSYKCKNCNIDNKQDLK